MAGLLYAGESSERVEARLYYENHSNVVRLKAGEITAHAALVDCQVSAPLGTMARTITLPTGQMFETTDHETMTVLDKLRRRGGGIQVWVDGIERRWRAVAALLVALLAVCAVTYVWGIPWAARQIAFSLPQSALTLTSDQVMSIMKLADGMKKTSLEPEHVKRLQAGFDKMTREQGGSYPYKLHFINAKSIGPNAFALPSGDIVITDQLIKLAKEDSEVLAVLAHEMTHVTQRHGMRMVIQNSGIVILFAGLLGDLSALSSLGASLPTLLAQSNYSRQFEVEADQGAAHYCHSCGWTTAPLRRMFRRMKDEIEGKDEGVQVDMDPTEIIATHPDMDRRIQLLRDADKKAGKPAEQE
jgi:Zn-dependent protease with chaperone function